MLQAVIFDFDGVITDSEILHFRVFNKVLSQYDIEITKNDYYRKYLGFTDLDCFKALINEGRLAIDENQINKLIEEKNQVFEELAKTEGSIIEGVREFLQMLQANNVPIAICSGALRSEIELILAEASLRHFFSVLVSAEQVKKGKPAPDGFELALRNLNEQSDNPVLPGQCVVIEDSHWGLEAAKAAGMHTIAVTNSYDADSLAGAEKITARLDDLKIEDLHGLCA